MKKFGDLDGKSKAVFTRAYNSMAHKAQAFVAEKTGKRRGHGGGGGEMSGAELGVPSMLKILGLEPGEMTTGGVGVNSTMTTNIQAFQEKGSDVAAKVNADLNQMRQRVHDFRKAFR